MQEYVRMDELQKEVQIMVGEVQEIGAVGSGYDD